MKKILFALICLASMSFIEWQPDFENAKKIAKEKHRIILLNFSGSDWCGPCIRMRKEILENEAFSKMADSSLVLVNADFPRNKKNQPDKIIKKQNESLADRYNPEGKFPFTLLLDADGKIIRSWDGFPPESVTQFVAEIKTIAEAHK